MTFAQIECFVEAARTGSYSKAAHNLFNTQQNISRQIKALEKELGVDLFVRKSHGVELTESGRLFLEAESEVLRKHNTVVDMIKDRSAKVGKRLRVGSGGLGSRVQGEILSIIMSYNAKYPDIDVDYMNEITVGRLIDGLENDRYDIIITYLAELEMINDIRLIQLNYRFGSPGIIISKKHPLSAKKDLKVEDLMDERWGVVARGSSIDHRIRIDSLRLRSILPRQTSR